MQEATTIAWVEGARVEVRDVRDLAMQLDEDPQRNVAPGSSAALSPGLAQAMGIWRATWRTVSELPVLNARKVEVASKRPVPAVLAGINRDVCSFMVQEGFLGVSQVAIPRTPSIVPQVVKLTSGGGEAIVRAGEIWRLLACGEPFHWGNVATAFAFVKWFLAVQGVEPTAVSVLSRLASEQMNNFQLMVQEEREVLSAGADRDGTEGTSRVIDFLAESLVRGCAEGQSIALAVQAGVLP